MSDIIFKVLVMLAFAIPTLLLILLTTSEDDGNHWAFKLYMFLLSPIVIIAYLWRGIKKLSTYPLRKRYNAPKYVQWRMLFSPLLREIEHIEDWFLLDTGEALKDADLFTDGHKEIAFTNNYNDEIEYGLRYLKYKRFDRYMNYSRAEVKDCLDELVGETLYNPITEETIAITNKKDLLYLYVIRYADRLEDDYELRKMESDNELKKKKAKIKQRIYSESKQQLERLANEDIDIFNNNNEKKDRDDSTTPSNYPLISLKPTKNKLGRGHRVEILFEGSGSDYRWLGEDFELMFMCDGVEQFTIRDIISSSMVQEDGTLVLAEGAVVTHYEETIVTARISIRGMLSQNSITIQGEHNNHIVSMHSHPMRNSETAVLWERGKIKND